MKQFKAMIGIIVLALLFASCQKDEIIPQPKVVTYSITGTGNHYSYYNIYVKQSVNGTVDAPGQELINQTLKSGDSISVSCIGHTTIPEMPSKLTVTVGSKVVYQEYLDKTGSAGYHTILK